MEQDNSGSPPSQNTDIFGFPLSPSLLPYANMQLLNPLEQQYFDSFLDGLTSAPPSYNNNTNSTQAQGFVSPAFLYQGNSGHKEQQQHYTRAQRDYIGQERVGDQQRQYMMKGEDMNRQQPLDTAIKNTPPPEGKIVSISTSTKKITSSVSTTKQKKPYSRPRQASSSSSSTTAATPITAEVKKALHIQSEQKRRAMVKSMFTNLNNILNPSLEKCTDTKAVTLNKAVAYLQDLKDRVRSLEGRLEELREIERRRNR